MSVANPSGGVRVDAGAGFDALHFLNVDDGGLRSNLFASALVDIAAELID